VKAWVLDTNVAVSGFLKPHAPPARLLSAFFARRLRLVYDARMLAEYGEVLARPEFGISRHDYIGFILMLRTSGELLTPPPVAIDLPDPDDLPFIETALASAEKTVVTKNFAHFQPAARLGLQILLPSEAIRALENAS
jgi:predicted nucleic acid-binding protein